MKIPCMYCGTAMDVPDEPGPVESCDCGWYRMGALSDEVPSQPRGPVTRRLIPEPCKHCREGIDRTPGHDSHWVHVDSGKVRCEIEPYGYLAEPVGSPCTASGPNPCLGAKFSARTVAFRNRGGKR